MYKLKQKDYIIIGLIIVIIIILYKPCVEMFETKVNDVTIKSQNIEPVPVEIAAKPYPKYAKKNNFNILEFESSKINSTGDYVKQFDEKLDILSRKGENPVSDIKCEMSDYTTDNGYVCMNKEQINIINKRGENRTVEY